LEPKADDGTGFNVCDYEDCTKEGGYGAGDTRLMKLSEPYEMAHDEKAIHVGVLTWFEGDDAATAGQWGAVCMAGEIHEFRLGEFLQQLADKNGFDRC